MINLSNIAIVGSGPTALYLLQNIYNHIDVLKNEIHQISIFEKEKNSGMGMPYNPYNTDIYNLANISSEEIPLLPESFADWLRKQDDTTLRKLNINELPIDDTKVYSRVALGYYFQTQFKDLLNHIISNGINVVQHCESEVVDIILLNGKQLNIVDRHEKSREFSTVIIATGHVWKEDDKPQHGYFASPWPIHKILPKSDKYYNFSIGTLGASLSAFDVVTSLAHRHGKFEKIDNKLKFIKHKKAPNFKMILHAAEGWLPHLQYEQEEPIREIYRHFDREQLLELIEDTGFMRIENYFDRLCRPALITAFTKDRLLNVVEELQNKNFSFKDWIKIMSERHEYVNSFEGMKLEMVTARNSVQNNIPIHWMETLDDLMYSLNYHSELLPAEDHLFFHKEIMSFLMNVIAALPLQSADLLLALHDAGSIELKSGFVNFPDDAFKTDKTKISVKDADGKIEELEYQLFINCGGQKKLEIEDYPFQSLVKNGNIRSAKVLFADSKNFDFSELDPDLIIKEKTKTNLKLSGIDIDSSYKTINKDGAANDFLYDINFTHTNGLRPYSYGLQACNATSMIVVESWLAKILEGKNVGNTIEKITELYENIDDL